MAVRLIYNPNRYGLSVSALTKWMINPVAFELEYFQGLIPVEDWNKNTGYGSLVGAGIEGWIKTRELRGVSKFIQTEFEQAIRIHTQYDDIGWWTELAEAQTKIFIDQYKKLFDKYNIHSAEEKLKETLTLPSGRQIVISGRLDGESDTVIFEHKCRAEWKAERIVEEIDLDLQYNFYLLLRYLSRGKLPDIVWYQHSKRPGGWGYHGPKQKKTETKRQHLKRLVEYINDNRDDHFYEYIAKPNQEVFERFLHVCLYPILERFMDWYEYMVTPNRKGLVNKHHFMTPYGLYNPYLEGTDEKFRRYAITGTTIGLMRKGRSIDAKTETNESVTITNKDAIEGIEV